MLGIPKTLAKISPRWFNLLEKANDWRDVELRQEAFGLKLDEFPCCVVGEAHKFSDSYVYREKCETCRFYSDELYFSTPLSSSSDAMISDISFVKSLKGFIKHFREEHQ